MAWSARMFMDKYRPWVGLLLVATMLLFGRSSEAVEYDCTLFSTPVVCAPPEVGEWWCDGNAYIIGGPTECEGEIKHEGHCPTIQVVADLIGEQWLGLHNECSSVTIDYQGPEIFSPPMFGLSPSSSRRFNATLHGTPPTCEINDAHAWCDRSIVCPTGYVSARPAGYEFCYRQLTSPFPLDGEKNKGKCPAISGGVAATSHPINLGVGNKFLAESDISQGQGGLKFVRAYNSLNAKGGSSLGTGWQHNLDLQLQVNFTSNGSSVSGSASARRADGRVIRFIQLTAGSPWITDADVSDRLLETRDSNGDLTGYQLIDGRSDQVERYNLAGQIASIEDERGATTLIFDYDSHLRLRSVIDRSGRQMQFGYDGDNLLARVWGPDSASGDVNSPHWSYTYGSVSPSTPQARNRLETVVSPDNVTRTYLYEDSANPYSLTGIIDENGKRYVSYGYDSQGRANSENLWSGPNMTAPVSQYSLTFLPNYLTHVVDPLGQERDYQFKIVQGVALVQSVSEPCAICGGPGSTKSRTYDPATGFTDLETDFNNTVTDHDYNARGLETQRIEAKTVNGVVPTEKRTISTTWHPDFRVPVLRNTFNSASGLEARTTWAYNARGQMVARCEIDTGNAAALNYVCSSTGGLPKGAMVRRTVNTYCDTVGTGCPLVGLLKTSNGARLTSDPGMNGLDDVVTYSYRESDDSSCATNGACTYRKGDLWKVTNALGQVTETVKYDKSGRPLRVKDANGTLTDLTYHPRGWLVDRIVRYNAGGFPSSNDATTHIDYDAVGNVTKVTQPDGVFLAYTYDAAHRLIRISDNLNNAIDYCPGGVGSAECLDAAGNRRIEQTKAGAAIKRSLRRSYNTLSQLIAVQNAQSLPTLSYPAADGYDANGNATNSIDGLNVKTHQDYDPLNRLKMTIQDFAGTDPDTANTTTGYVYDARDNLRTVTDPELYPTNYDYDGLNNLTGLHSPDTGDTAYTYDLAGNRISQTDNRGVTSTYTYDALNRLTGIAYPTSTLNVSFAYDQSNATTGCSVSYPKGRLTQMTDESGQTTYCYDRRGNVILKTQQDFGQRVVAYSYTLADRLASITYPSGAVVTYGRDSVGRINSVKRRPDANSADVTIVSNASYYPFGPLNVLTYGNGRFLTKDYDDNYAINSVASSDPSGLILDFTTDVMGNIVDASDSIGATTKTRKYVYDHLYRLNGVTDNGNNPLEDYAYNQTGDRTHKQLGVQAPQVYNYLANTHRLASVDGAQRSYDDNGNTLQRGDGVSFSYNERNRLAIVTPPAFGSGAKAFGAPKPNQSYYHYNGRGERVSISHSLQLTTTSFTYDEQGHQLGSYFGYNSSGDEVIYLDDMPVAITDGNVLSYLETDHLGTPRIAANVTTNAQQWKWDFFGDAFGGNEPVIAASGGIDVRLRYPGQYADGYGVNYNYFRDYEAGTGRYLESDPIGLRGGISTYLYVRGRPLSLLDRTGLVCQGTWQQVGSVNPDLSFLGSFGTLITNSICRCVWLCKPCAGEYMWSGVPWDNSLPRTTGVPSNMDLGQGQIVSGPHETQDASVAPNWCNCKKPSEEAGCCK
jgi:RHS repeat-associated protein